MNGIYTVLLLIGSNIFMTFAWYGHLKLQDMNITTNWPLYAIILFSWLIALAEYSLQVPANRIGFVENGGPFSLMQLKVIQEVISLVVFTLFTKVLFGNESLHWNHYVAFLCLLLAVYFVFMKTE
ncbi:MAG: DMT family protein [Bacteroidaceae bacterium]|nr:DMT family protein [Bacteroidaceae bacterium]